MVYYNNLKLTSVQQSILAYLFQTQGILVTQKTIAQNIGYSEMAVKKALVYLLDQGFIRFNKSENRTAIHISEENEYIMGLKRYWNITKIYASGVLASLKDSFPGCTVILFGSYSRGDDLHNSDIDIAIIGSSKKTVSLESFEKEFQKKIHISFFENFSEIHKNLKENLYNGIVLAGAISI